MRIMPLLKAACLSLMLSACVAPLLLMSPTSQLMWALLKPLVGFDPNEANLFEQPLIKDRMSAILGPNYDTTMQLLKTANELQQEGPLFYVVSRYAPMPDIAKQAGMVWNSQTNQMSVLLQQGDGTTQTFGENLASSAPIWPTAMQGWQTQISTAPPTLTTLTDMAVSSTAAAVTQEAANAVAAPAKQAVSSAAATVIQEATNAVTAPAKQAAAAVTQEATNAVAAPAKQAVSSAAATVTQEATNAVTAPAKQAVSAAAILTQEATNAVATPAKQAVSSAAATVIQEATNAVATPAKQAVGSAASHTAGESIADAARAAEAATRARAEAELEAMLE